KRRAQCEPEPKTANQRPRSRYLPNRSARHFGEAILGEMPAGGHQLDTVGAEEIRAVVPIERDDRPVRRPRLPEPFERLHPVMRLLPTPRYRQAVRAES